MKAPWKSPIFRRRSSLLVVVLCLIAFLGWKEISWQLKVRHLEQLGWSIRVVDGQLDIRERHDDICVAMEAADGKLPLLLDLGSNISCLTLQPFPLTVQQLEKVATLPTLQELNVGHCQLASPHFKIISQMKGLRILDLSGSTINSDDARLLSSLPNLHALTLKDTQLGNGVFRHFSTMQRLQTLDLSYLRGNITADDARLISSLPKLRTLILRDCVVYEYVIHHLASSKTLRRFDLLGCGFPQDELEPLCDSPQIEYLRLSDSDCFHLDIDWLMLKIVAMESLKTCDLRCVRELSLADVEELARKRPNLNIIHSEHIAETRDAYVENEPDFDEEDFLMPYDGEPLEKVPSLEDILPKEDDFGLGDLRSGDLRQ